MKKFLLILGLFVSLPVLAQETTGVEADSSSFIEKNFKVTGDAGVYGELYSTQGIERRRPASTARLFFRPTFSFFNLIDIPVEVLISTEGSSARQNINQFGINPTWGWGTAHLGDFTESFSEFTLNGIIIRGGGITINPGILRLAVASGFTQRAVDGGAENGSYDRFLFASRLGIGKESSSYFDLIVVKSKDKISSVTSDKKIITVLNPNGNDVIPVGSFQNIRWNSANIQGNVKIELSRDGGVTYEILYDNQPNTQIVQWNVTGMESFQALIKITSVDDSSIYDISDSYFTIVNGAQYKEGNLLPQTENSFAFSPQENLVLGTQGRLKLFDVLTLNAEASGSIFTRDMRSEAINLDTLDLPAFVKKIYKPNLSTNVDYAVNTEAALNVQNFNLKLGYKYIGPGYNSLGLSYVINDQKQISALAGYRFDRYFISANWLRTNDNLIKQKLYTTTRNQFGINFNGMLTSIWNLNLMINALNMNNDAPNDTTKTKFSNLIFGMNHSFTFTDAGYLRGINLQYTYQNSDNRYGLLPSNSTKIHTVNAGAMFYLSESISGNASIGIISSKLLDTLRTVTQLYTVGLQQKILGNKLTNSYSVTTSFRKDNSVFRITVLSRYLFTTDDAISLSLLYTNFHGKAVTLKSYNELLASVTFTHSF